jgi:Ca2+-binding RTX toxin-like protein
MILNAGSATEGNALAISGTASADTLEMDVATFLHRITWFETGRTLLPLGFSAMTLELAEGNDGLRAAEPWTGVTLDVDGGAGRDRLQGQSEDDSIVGAAGNDRLSGGAGADTIKGQTGTDVCKGGSGKDTITSCEQVTP